MHFDTRTYGPYLRVVRTVHPYIRPVYTARTKQQFFSAVRPIRTTRTYGPYVRTYGCISDTRIYGPYVRVSKSSPVYTGRIYGPYKSPVKSQNIYLETLCHYWLFVIKHSLLWYKEINVSTRSLSAQNCVSEHRGKYGASSSNHTHFTNSRSEQRTCNIGRILCTKTYDNKYIPLRVMTDVAWRHQQFRTKYLYLLLLIAVFAVRPVYTDRMYG